MSSRGWPAAHPAILTRPRPRHRGSHTSGEWPVRVLSSERDVALGSPRLLRVPRCLPSPGPEAPSVAEGVTHEHHRAPGRVHPSARRRAHSPPPASTPPPLAPARRRRHRRRPRHRGAYGPAAAGTRCGHGRPPAAAWCAAARSAARPIPGPADRLRDHRRGRVLFINFILAASSTRFLLTTCFSPRSSTAVLYVGYFAFFESYRGQTIGKQVMKLKVFGPDGASNPTMEQAVAPQHLAGLRHRRRHPGPRRVPRRSSPRSAPSS